MQKLTTYLIGSIQDIPSGGTEWRKKITPKLETLGITVQDPTISEVNKEYGETILQTRDKLKQFKKRQLWEDFDPHMRNVILTDLACVNSSDFVICYWNCEYRHGGTVHELAEAWAHHIPIYMVLYDNFTDMNDWVLGLVRMSGRTFENFGQLMDFIEIKYKKEIKEILGKKDVVKV